MIKALILQWHLLAKATSKMAVRSPTAAVKQTRTDYGK